MTTTRNTCGGIRGRKELYIGDDSRNNQRTRKTNWTVAVIWKEFKNNRENHEIQDNERQNERTNLHYYLRQHMTKLRTSVVCKITVTQFNSGRTRTTAKEAIQVQTQLAVGSQHETRYIDQTIKWSNDQMIKCHLAKKKEKHSSSKQNSQNIVEPIYATK
jgi:hypothetical protein